MTATRTRAPRRDATENRDALLAAARALLSRDPAATLDAIAAEAGLSRRSMYGHFANRESLLAELARHGAARVSAAVTAVEASDPVLRLALIAAAAWDDIENVRALTLMTVRSGRLALVDEALAPLRARLITTLEEGAVSGALRDDVPAPRLARLLIDAVLAVFAEHDLDRDAGRRLVVTVTLALAGLGHADTAAFLAAHPALADTETALR